MACVQLTLAALFPIGLRVELYELSVLLWCFVIPGDPNNVSDLMDAEH